MQVIDYSAAYPSPAAVKAAGYAGAVRYLRKEGASRVLPITAQERTGYHAQGLAVALVYQHVSKTRVTEGHAAGVHDARWALARAADIGIPNPRAIYFAVDDDHDPARVNGYFRGAAEVLGAARTGAYGSYRVVKHLLDAKLIAYAWQTVAWSGGKREPRAALFQRAGQPLVAGVRVDINDVLVADWGQHPYATGKKDDEEDDVPLTQQDREQIAKAHFWDVPFEGNENFAGYLKRTMSELRALLEVVAKVTADPDITRDAVAGILDDAVRRHSPSAEEVAAAQRPALVAVLREVLGEDNAEEADRQADLVVAKLIERVSGGADSANG